MFLFPQVSSGIQVLPGLVFHKGGELLDDLQRALLTTGTPFSGIEWDYIKRCTESCICMIDPDTLDFGGNTNLLEIATEYINQHCREA